MEKYKSYGPLSETTHFPSVFCEVGVVQQCTEAQAGVVQDVLRSFCVQLTTLKTYVGWAVVGGGGEETVNNSITSATDLQNK